MTTMPLRVALDPRVANLPPDLLEYYTGLWARSHLKAGEAAVYCDGRDERLRSLDKAGLVFPQLLGRWRWATESGGSVGTFEILVLLEVPRVPSITCDPTKT